MKKISAISLVLCVCFLLASCSQAKPNYDNIVSFDKNPIQEELPNTFDSANSVPTPGMPDAASEIATNELTVNYLGLGQVVFRVIEIELTNNPPEEDNQNGKKQENHLLISFEIENIDVPSEEEMAKNGLANCFRIYPNNPSEISDPNMLWLSEPDYFSDVRESTDEKSYFRFSIPDIGKAKTFTLGWTLNTLGVQLLKQNKLSLTCIFAEGLSMPIYYNTTPGITG